MVDKFLSNGAYVRENKGKTIKIRNITAELRDLWATIPHKSDGNEKEQKRLKLFGFSHLNTLGFKLFLTTPLLSLSRLFFLSQSHVGYH